MADTLSGMTANEAQEFHKEFMKGFMIFTVVAIVAHILVFMWRPWFPPEGGYKMSMLDSVEQFTTTIMPFVG